MANAHHPLLTTAVPLGLRLAARVLTRDDLHLTPERISQAAARRFRAGLRALEAFVRRLIILLALDLEHTLTSWDQSAVCVRRDGKASQDPQSFHFDVFPIERPAPSDRLWAEGFSDGFNSGGGERGHISPRRLLQRLLSLKALLEAPHARAKRLAFTFARRRPGPLLAPAGRVPGKYGTEVSALHTSLGAAILTASRARPPPLGPLPRPRPRIRTL